jgi:DNA-directed RNA polymerase subunit K/omega
MNENPPVEPTQITPPVDEEPKPEPVPDRVGPTVPAPHERSPEVDRRLRRAVQEMFEEETNPYEAVVVAAQEARQINQQRLRARSILNQAVEPVEDLVPEVPFVPRPIEDDVPEIKPTNESIEKMACGLVEFEIGDERFRSKNYYGEIDFDLYPERNEDETPEAPEAS